MLLGWDDSLAGFADFTWRHFPNTKIYSSAAGVAGATRHPCHSGNRRPQWSSRRNPVTKPAFDCAEEVTRRFLRGLGMGLDEIDLLVPAPSSNKDFLDTLRAKLAFEQPSRLYNRRP